MARPAAVGAGHPTSLCGRPQPGRVLRPGCGRSAGLRRCCAPGARAWARDEGSRHDQPGQPCLPSSAWTMLLWRMSAARQASAAWRTGVVCANYNSPGQVVISGDVAAMDAAVALAKERGARRAIPLAVSIASHSPLMNEAAQEFAAAVAAARHHSPATCRWLPMSPLARWPRRRTFATRWSPS